MGHAAVLWPINDNSPIGLRSNQNPDNDFSALGIKDYTLYYIYARASNSLSPCCWKSNQKNRLNSCIYAKKIVPLGHQYIFELMILDISHITSLPNRQIDDLQKPRLTEWHTESAKVAEMRQSGIRMDVYFKNCGLMPNKIGRKITFFSNFSFDF